MHCRTCGQYIENARLCDSCLIDRQEAPVTIALDELGEMSPARDWSPVYACLLVGALVITGVLAALTLALSRQPAMISGW